MDYKLLCLIESAACTLELLQIVGRNNNENEDVEKEKIPCTGFIIKEYITCPICNEEIVLKSYFKEGDIK